MMEAAQAGDCGLLQKLMDPVRSGLPADLADTVSVCREVAPSKTLNHPFARIVVKPGWLDGVA